MFWICMFRSMHSGSMRSRYMCSGSMHSSFMHSCSISSCSILSGLYVLVLYVPVLCIPGLCIPILCVPHLQITKTNPRHLSEILNTKLESGKRVKQTNKQTEPTSCWVMWHHAVTWSNTPVWTWTYPDHMWSHSVNETRAVAPVWAEELNISPGI